VEERYPELGHAIKPEANELFEERRLTLGKGPRRERDEVLGIEIDSYRFALCHTVVPFGDV
jgi:hypothetical protein